MFYLFDKLSFNILSISVFTHKPGFFNVKARNYASMGIRLSGSGFFRINGQSFASNVGDVLFIPAGMDYDVEYSGGESLVVHFTDCNYNQADFISLQRVERVKSKFINLLDSWKTEPNINRIKSQIYDILYLIHEDKRIAFDDVFLHGVRFIDEHFTNTSLRITDVCSAVGLSESGLHRRFIAYFKQSPKEYLQNLRLRHAMELLFKGEFSVKEIAYLSGFSDEKYFSRFIKQKLGKSPSYFLKQRFV